VGSQSAATRDIWGSISLSNSIRFALSSGEKMLTPVTLAPRPRKAATKSSRDEIIGYRNNWDRRRRLLDQTWSEITECRDDAHIQVGQLGRELAQTFGRFCPTQVDRHVLSFDIARLTESLPKPVHPRKRRRCSANPQDSDPHYLPRRLRLCGERRGEEYRPRASEERATVYHSGIPLTGAARPRRGAIGAHRGGAVAVRCNEMVRPSTTPLISSPLTLSSTYDDEPCTGL
jgi:hypothetical protein